MTLLIQLLREESIWPGYYRGMQPGRVWLPAVVAAEVYAGTRSLADSRPFDRLVALLRRVGRVLVPTDQEWESAGRLMARYTRLHGSIRSRDQLADVLVALCAARVSGSVVTSNVRDFDRWVRLARAARLDIDLVEPIR